HQMEYEPAFSVTSSVADFPGAIVAVRAFATPGPERTSACGNLPTFFTTSIAGPAGTFAGARVIRNSRPVTTIFALVAPRCAATPARAAPARASAKTTTSRTGVR